LTPDPAQASSDDALLAKASAADFVLLGEATHGAREFYLERARITETLAAAGRLRAVAIEGDWSGAERVNRYVRGLGSDTSADQALSDFDAFPAWAWRNAEFRDFIERLRAINLARAPEQRIGVYGLDVYDVDDAADAVIEGLSKLSPSAAAAARKGYRCLAPYRRAMEAYGVAVRHGKSCEAGALAGLRAAAALGPAAPGEAEARFAIRQAAAVVAGGEAYYRVNETTGYSWNVRDRSMAQSARAVREHVGGQVAIWAHNTHVGDGRATAMKERGEVSLGQLLRESGSALLVGQLTAGGQTLAASEWNGMARVFELEPSAPGSHEAALASGSPRQVLIGPELPSGRRAPERGVGAVYPRQPAKRVEYFRADLGRQFDAVIFTRATTAITPLRGALRPQTAAASSAR